MLAGAIGRSWLKELDTEIVHIDPYFDDTAQFLGGKYMAVKPFFASRARKAG